MGFLLSIILGLGQALYDLLCLTFMAIGLVDVAL